MPKNIPNGIDNYSELVDKNHNYLYVDKTEFIKAIIDDKTKVTLITRPRRWGKTLNMSMLHHFLSNEVSRISTKGLFDGLEIAKIDGGEYLKKHQGQYPVIFISFKDVKESSFDETLRKMKILIQDLYGEHRYLLNSTEIEEDEKSDFRRYLIKDVDKVELEESFKFLCKLLYRYHKKKGYILIDEYDTPLNSAHDKDYFEELTEFMKNLLSSSLKGNNYLEKGVMTGILRISQNSMLSGLNNVDTHTMLADDAYSKYFGFTEEEINSLFNEANINISEIGQSIKEWYDGYNIEGLRLYNPLSIIKCIMSKGELKPYWLNTGNEDLLKTAFINASDTAKEQLQQLISRNSIEAFVSETTQFSSLDKDDSALWSLLLATGYLTYEKKESSDTDYKCELKIPNNEVYGLYKKIFSSWLETKIGKNEYTLFLNHLVSGDIKAFTELLGEYLVTHASQYEFLNESNYHTFMLGILCGITNTHYLFSNPNSGYGRADVLLVPKDNSNNLGIILEFKHVKKNEKQRKLAEDGLDQIDTNHYQAFLNRYTYIEKVLKVGMAFEDRSVLSVHRFSNLENEPISELETSSFILEELCDSESSQEERIKWQDKKRKKEERGSSEEDTSDEETSKKKLKKNSTSSEKDKPKKTIMDKPNQKGFFAPFLGNKKIIHNSSFEKDKEEETKRPKQSSSRE